MSFDDENEIDLPDWPVELENDFIIQADNYEKDFITKLRNRKFDIFFRVLSQSQSHRKEEHMALTLYALAISLEEHLTATLENATNLSSTFPSKNLETYVEMLHALKEHSTNTKNYVNHVVKIPDDWPEPEEIAAQLLMLEAALKQYASKLQILDSTYRYSVNTELRCVNKLIDTADSLFNVLKFDRDLVIQGDNPWMSAFVDVDFGVDCDGTSESHPDESSNLPIIAEEEVSTPRSASTPSIAASSLVGCESPPLNRSVSTLELSKLIIPEGSRTPQPNEKNSMMSPHGSEATLQGTPGFKPADSVGGSFSPFSPSLMHSSQSPAPFLASFDSYRVGEAGSSLGDPTTMAARTECVLKPQGSPLRQVKLSTDLLNRFKPK